MHTLENISISFNLFVEINAAHGNVDADKKNRLNGLRPMAMPMRRSSLAVLVVYKINLNSDALCSDRDGILQTGT